MLTDYIDDNTNLWIFVIAYLLKQTFAIPGSVLLNVLAGHLYGPDYGFLLTCLLTTLGSTLCYLLSSCLGTRIGIAEWDKVKSVKSKFQTETRGKNNMLLFLISVRLFPFSPNWLINLSAPWIGVRIGDFCTSTLVGCIPYTLMASQAGSLYSTVHTTRDIFTKSVLIKLALISIGSMLMFLYRIHRKKHMNTV